MTMTLVEYDRDDRGAYALLEDEDGLTTWRFRDLGQYGYSDNATAIFEFGATWDFEGTEFNSLKDFKALIHTVTDKLINIESYSLTFNLAGERIVRKKPDDSIQAKVRQKKRLGGAS